MIASTRRIKAVIALAVAVGLAGCTGDDPAAEPTPSPSRTRPSDATITDQRVVLAAGADVGRGALVQACDETGCRRLASRATARVEVADAKPVLSIAFERRPDAVEALLKTKGRRGDVETLDAGLLVAWRPRVAIGRHDVRIVATYGSTRLEWSVLLIRR